MNKQRYVSKRRMIPPRVPIDFGSEIADAGFDLDPSLVQSQAGQYFVKNIGLFGEADPTEKVGSVIEQQTADSGQDTALTVSDEHPASANIQPPPSHRKEGRPKVLRRIMKGGMLAERVVRRRETRTMGAEDLDAGDDDAEFQRLDPESILALRARDDPREQMILALRYPDTDLVAREPRDNWQAYPHDLATPPQLPPLPPRERLAERRRLAREEAGFFQPPLPPSREGEALAERRAEEEQAREEFADAVHAYADHLESIGIYPDRVEDVARQMNSDYPDLNQMMSILRQRYR